MPNRLDHMLDTQLCRAMTNRPHYPPFSGASQSSFRLRKFLEMTQRTAVIKTIYRKQRISEKAHRCIYTLILQCTPAGSRNHAVSHLQ